MRGQEDNHVSSNGPGDINVESPRRERSCADGRDGLGPEPAPRTARRANGEEPAAAGRSASPAWSEHFRRFRGWRTTLLSERSSAAREFRRNSRRRLPRGAAHALLIRITSAASDFVTAFYAREILHGT